MKKIIGIGVACALIIVVFCVAFSGCGGISAGQELANETAYLDAFEDTIDLFTDDDESQVTMSVTMEVDSNGTYGYSNEVIKKDGLNYYVTSNAETKGIGGSSKITLELYASKVLSQEPVQDENETVYDDEFYVQNTDKEWYKCDNYDTTIDEMIQGMFDYVEGPEFDYLEYDDGYYIYETKGAIAKYSFKNGLLLGIELTSDSSYCDITNVTVVTVEFKYSASVKLPELV